MKTLKLTLVATLVAFTVATMANVDGFKSKPKKVVHTTYANAIRNPELVKSMYEELDPSFLDTFEQLYVVDVEHNNIKYRILGSRKSWIMFFRMKWQFPGGGKNKVKNIH